jgi:hypothetical protein
MESLARESERISRIHRCFLRDLSVISIQRAKYYTQTWIETDAITLPLEVRVGLAMNHVYENMDICIHRDDRIAGSWTENYLGIPLDIERGLFNEVMEIELDRYSMLHCLMKTNLRFIRYMIEKHGIRGFYGNFKQIRAVGAAMPSIGTTPVHQRKINPYAIRSSDKRILKRDLLSYWKGKTIVDLLKKELESSDVY